MRNYFPKLYGNDAVKTRLGEAITNESLPHAFLLIGPDGSGKKTLTAEIAAALNCENKSDLNTSLPCHRCNTCRKCIFNINCDTYKDKEENLSAKPQLVVLDGKPF